MMVTRIPQIYILKMKEFGSFAHFGHAFFGFCTLLVISCSISNMKKSQFFSLYLQATHTSLIQDSLHIYEPNRGKAK